VDDEEVSRRIVDGEPYQRAELTVRRTFPLSLGQKIQIASGALAASVVIAPALFLRRGLIRSIEGTGPLPETLGLVIVTLALLGILTTFAAGLVLVRQEYVVSRRSLTAEQARRLVRVEDVVMWFVLQGATFILIAAAAAVVGLLSPDAVKRLYGYGVTVYQPSTTFGIDARLVSGLGVVLAAVLSGAWFRVRALV
jgi:hypothetical protein